MGTDNDLIHGETWPSLLSLFVSTSLLHNCLLNVQRQAVLKQSFCGRLEVKQCFAYYAVRSQSWDLSNLNNWTNLHCGICCLWALEDVFFLQDAFSCTSIGLYSLALSCIYSICKSCWAVCIYNNTVYSYCMRFAWLSPIYLNMAAGHRFICWSVIAPCLSAPFFRGIFHTVSGGICNDGGGRLCVACVHTLIALCVVVWIWEVIIMTGLCPCFSL